MKIFFNQRFLFFEKNKASDHYPHWWGFALSLTLIAIGTGGIKPVLSSFLGGFRTEHSCIKNFKKLFFLFLLL